MHAARAINKNREKREEKTKHETRRHSAVSHIDWSIPRSPGASLDAAARRAHHEDKADSGEIDSGSSSLIPNSASLPRQPLHHHHDSDNLNFSYIGFIIAVFGAVPLIVGTFVEVPALWEIGLGVTLVGLFIGIVFWCTELCAEAKKFAQKKNQLSTRGKIEDSNLLQVPERKFTQGNGLESRRSSFQSDSVSLITPTAQHYERNPALQHHQFHPNNFPHVHAERKHSTPPSQYSSAKSDESSATTLQYYGSIRNNGNIIAPPPPRLMLRGSGRKDDGRVVSLVQPDPGLDDGDSDSDAETVIEAPTGRTKIIHVQSQVQGQHHHRHHSDTFTVENESVSPLYPLAAQHRTIRMPVMPQEVEKLQRCECGRYLLTERDKLLGIKLSKIGVGEGGTMVYNSPTIVPGAKKIFNAKGELMTPDSNTSSESTNEPYSPDDLTPQSPDPPQLLCPHPISVVTSGGTLTKSSRVVSSIDNHDFNNEDDGDYDSDTLKKVHTPKLSHNPRQNESVVEVEPSYSSSDLLSAAQARRTENVGQGSTEFEALKNVKRMQEEVILDDDDHNSGDYLHELMQDISEVANRENTSTIQENPSLTVRVRSSIQAPEAEGEENDSEDEFADSHKKSDNSEEVRSPPLPTRPTYLHLPVMLTETVMSGPPETVEITSGPMTSSSSCSSASTVVFLGSSFPSESIAKLTEDAEQDEQETKQEGVPEIGGKRENLKKELSLDELLDKIEKHPADDVLAVVVS